MTPVRRISVAALALFALLAVAGCGVGHELDVREGEPVDLGSLEYNVRLTRFLNPADNEDRYYLKGAPKLKPGTQYLGVFMTIDNRGSAGATPAAGMHVTDTRENRYDVTRYRNDFTLDFTPIAGKSKRPVPDSPPAQGPIKGSLVLFVVAQGATENRPLELKIPGPSETATVKLDI